MTFLAARLRRLTPGRLALRVLVGAVIFLAVGNLAILGATLAARRTVPPVGQTAPEGVGNFRVVDDKVWRGAAPSKAGIEALAARGVRTFVDLRAEDDLVVDRVLFDRLGVTRIALPVRDGQTPTDEQLRRFFATVRDADGTVFVHCGAGVGRTGSVVGAYLQATGQAGAREALVRNLAVGPPSLEQIAYVGTGDRPASPLVAMSRVLDGPRRLYVRLIK